MYNSLIVQPMKTIKSWMMCNFQHQFTNQIDKNNTSNLAPLHPLTIVMQVFPCTRHLICKNFFSLLQVCLICIQVFRKAINSLLIRYIPTNATLLLSLFIFSLHHRYLFFQNYNTFTGALCCLMSIA